MALLFPSRIEAWDSKTEAVTFAAEDAGTKAPIMCAVTGRALVIHFKAPRHLPDLISVFRQNRDIVEQVASITYDLHGRRGPVILRENDFVGRLKPPAVH